MHRQHLFKSIWAVAGLCIGLAGSLPVCAAPVKSPVTLPMANQTLPSPVRLALQQAQVPASALSVWVAPLASDSHPLLAHRADAEVNPASLMKLVTTWAGLTLLGPGHTWTNRVWTTGKLEQQHLSGDLVLQGSGDPKLVVERLRELVQQIRAQGVHSIGGDVVLDRSVFDVRPQTEAFDDEPLRPYNVAPDGLLLNFKALIYKFHPDPGAGVARLEVEPPIADVHWPASVPLTSGPCQDWRRQLRGDFGHPDRIRFEGGYPAACGSQEWPVAYSAPELHAPRVFKALWLEAGGRLGGQVRWGATPPNARPLLQLPSLPLSEVIADINKFSNNVMAQQLFLTLSAQPGVPGRLVASQVRLRQWWQHALPGQAAPVLDNGSGLSRSERITARALGSLLQLAGSSPMAPVFLQSLSLAGVDGTTQRLRESRPDAGLIGRARLKTGSLRDVASVAGYVQSPEGQQRIVVAIINHPQASQARPALQAVLEWSARQSERP
jgi:D-alanyl-D-alanine carboxypeptidase/D-alanyl-D-alanine-endopeptidase (penicillin-binding protein 4)